MRLLNYTLLLSIICTPLFGNSPLQEVPSNNNAAIDSLAVHSHIDSVEAEIWYYFYENLDSALFLSQYLIAYISDKKVANKQAFQVKKLYANVLNQSGQYENALEVLYQLLDETDSVLYPIRYADALYTMALLHDEQLEDHTTAMTLYKRVTKIFDLANDHSIKPKIYHAIGDCYRFMGEYDSSLVYINKSLAIWLADSTSSEGIALVYFAKCETLCAKKMYKEAFLVLEESYKLNDQSSFSTYAQGYQIMVKGTILAGLGRLDESIRVFKKVEKLGIEMNYSRGLILIYEELIPILARAKRYEEGFIYQKKYIDLQQKLMDLERTNAIKTAEVKFDAKTKHKEILALRQIQTIQSLEADKREVWLMSLVLGLLFLITTILLIFRQSRLKAKSYELLSEKNKKIETLMRELHHRVKNNLQVISSLLGLQSMKMEDSVAKEAIEEGKNRVKAMSMIHQRLYQGTDIARIDFETYTKDLIEELKNCYQHSQGVQIELSIPSTYFDVDTTLPLGLIMNEIVTNSFKYAFDDINQPILKVALIQKENHFQLTIADNGPGIREKIDISKATSFGLKLVNILTRQLKGTLSSFNNNGLNYHIEFDTNLSKTY